LSRHAKADRRQQRRLERLIRKDEKRAVGSIEDAAFFEQNPKRNFRMRLATPGEIAATEIIGNGGAPLPLPEGALWWTIIKQVSPGVRFRVQVYAPLPPWPLKEIPEQVAREVFNVAIGHEAET
jgi:hypothetical protein